MLRVDDRLIHGQIALRWTKYLQVDSIILANDDAAGDKSKQMLLKMACPNGVKLAVTTIADSITFMNDPRLENRKVLTIVNCPEDALTILKEVPHVKIFNMGNYGSNTGRKSDRKQYCNGFTADESEIAIVNEILKLGIPSTAQQMPETEQYQLADIVKKPMVG